MSLYNMLFGQNANADAILAMVGRTKEDFGRFRDCFVDGEGRVAVYTRNGGGNRDHWDFSYPDNEAGEGCPCVGCFMTYRVHKLPNYLYDRDDDFDSTYATIYFRVPGEFKFIADALREDFNPDQKWRDQLATIKQPDYVIPEPMRALIEQIAEFAKDTPA